MKHFFAGEKLLSQAILRTREHIESQKMGRTTLSVMMNAMTNHSKVGDYIEGERKRLAKLEKINGQPRE